MPPSGSGPFARTSQLSAALALWAISSLTGCPGQSDNAPTKVEAAVPFNRPQPGDAIPAEPDPSRDPPAGREGTQLAKPDIDKALAAAAEAGKAGNSYAEQTELAKCANKTPASARCDGALGLSVAPAKKRRAFAEYYLIAASATDDPDADAALYSAVAEALRAHGLIDNAIEAQRKAVARDGSPAQRFALGRLLSLDTELLSEAADAIASARAEEDKIEWQYEEAIVRGQIPTREDATIARELLEAYVARVEALPDGDPAKIDTKALPARIAELEALAKAYGTRKEYAASKAAGPAPQPEPTDPATPPA